MTIKEIKELLANADDNDTLEIIDGELTLVKNIENYFKFNIGNKVKIVSLNQIGKIVDKFIYKNQLAYKIKIPGINYLQHIPEDDIELFNKEDKDITKRIKTFDDAYDWCEENGYNELTYEFEGVVRMNQDISDDVFAYMALRIITIALNEGWKPTYKDDEQRWYVYYDAKLMKIMSGYEDITHTYQTPASLLFKSQKLAEYAETQFTDYYLKFGELL